MNAISLMNTLVLAASLTFLPACKATSEDTSANASSQLREPIMQQPMQQTAATRIYTHGNIITMVNSQPQQAIAIAGSEILYVGNNRHALTYTDEHTEIINLQGLTMIPGIHDSHIHALEAGSEVGGNCWLEGKQLKDLKKPLLNCKKKQKGTHWLLAYGHELEALLHETDDPRALLDSWISDRPVAIMEQTSHSAWVNSRALKEAGISALTPDPQGGLIMRYGTEHKTRPANEPNGILLETAGETVFDLALKPSDQSFDLNYDGLMWVMEELPKYGITSIADARVYWQRGWLDVWHQAEQDNALSVRVNLGLWAYANINDTQQLNFLAQQYRFDPRRLLQINQIKIYSDGIIHNTTAAVKEPYEFNIGRVPERGLNYFQQNRLSRYIQHLQQAGFDFHIHTIGDRGVHEALNAIEKNMAEKPDHRHRLTHVEMLDDNDLPRFKQLNTIADMQVAGDFTLPEYHHWQEPYIGKRAYHTYRLKDLINSGATVVLSSDWTVNSLNPFIGIANAINRGKQSISVKQALETYTINAAYLMRSEDRTGSLEAGKQADLVIIDRDISRVSARKIAETQVLLTMMAGEITFQSDDL